MGVGLRRRTAGVRAPRRLLRLPCPRWSVRGPEDRNRAYGTTSAPDGRQHPAGPEETARVYRAYVRDRLPWLSPEPVRSASCLYTSTRDNRFVIDRHPEHDAVLIVSACSGHGFKHSPAIGELVAGWATGSPPPDDVDVEAFRLTHAIG